MDDDALFLSVIDGGSFRSAAAASGLDPSRVSRRIAALEARLVSLLPEARFDAFPIHAVWSPTPFQPAAPRAFIAATADALRKAGLT